MKNNYKLDSLKNRISEEDEDGAYKVIYMWIKQGHISLREFKELIKGIVEEDRA